MCIIKNIKKKNFVNKIFVQKRRFDPFLFIFNKFFFVLAFCPYNIGKIPLMLFNTGNDVRII